MNRSADSNPLEKVLAPVAADEFFNSHWEKSPLHIERSDSQYFRSLLTLEDIETFLSTQQLVYPSVRLAHSASPVSASEYTDDQGIVLPLSLAEHYGNGATIVISQAHQKLPALADFRRQFQRDCKLRCQTNVYLSPPGKQGFKAHYDSHDVFILQVQGIKTFNFYAGGVELPYNSEGFDEDRHIAGDIQESITLHAGDSLYIPRGVMHDAVAIDLTSLHITLGVYAVTVRDLLYEIVQGMGDQEVKLRQSLPPALLRDPSGSQKSLQSLVGSVLSKTGSSTYLAPALQRLADHIAIDAQPDCTGLLSQNRSLSSLTSSSRIVLKRHLCFDVQRTGLSVRCLAMGQVIEFQGPLGNGMEQLWAAPVVQFNELNNLDDDQKLALLDRLMHANLIEIT